VTIAARFLALVVDPAVHEPLAEVPDLDTLLADQLADGRTTWPAVSVDDDVYLRQLADAVRARADESAERVVRTMPGADLYLAAACAAGDPRAIATFRTELVPPLRDVIARLGASPTAVDETEQHVLEAVLVAAPGGRPQIANYSGRGRLRSWLRSIAVRTGRRLLGTPAPAAGNDDLVDRLPAAAADPALELVRGRYADRFRAAFVAAFAELTERQRNLLRQYHIDELTIDELGRLYQVNRATAARWVIGARTALLDATRTRLAADLAIVTSEVDSIIRLVRSRIDLSIRELFGPAQPG
jgi:RNA polymerase sigma-70 factor (ECF subfamily)